MAHFLVLSGRGTLGATLEELSREPRLREVFCELRGAANPLLDGVHEFPDAEFTECLGDLIFHSLLRANGDRYAPFHELLLVHLAADELARLSRRNEQEGDGAPPPPPAPPEVDSPLPTILSPLVWAGCPAAFSADDNVHAASRAPGALLEQTWDYVAHFHYPEIPEEADRERMLTLPPEVRSGQLGRATADEVIRRDAVVRAHPGERDRLVGIDRERLKERAGGGPVSLTHEGHDLLALPPGEYVLWAGEVKNRELIRFPLPAALYLARHPCTVEQYARFLRANLNHPGPPLALPNAPEVGWSRHGGPVRYAPERGGHPTSGLTAEEAEAYCRWLADQLASADLVPGHIPQVSLPSPEELRVAIHGASVWDLQEGPGPFGHEDLIRIWHWTARAPGHGTRERVLVGGGPGIDLKELRKWWSTHGRAVPPGERDKDTGFRVAVRFAPRGSPHPG